MTETEALRLAMRAWTTGVAILSAEHEGESYAMTVNSFTSLSIDPPMVTVVLKNDTRVFELADKSRAFRVFILSDSQRELAEDFAGRLHGAERMDKLGRGASLLDEGLARLDCAIVHAYAAGVNTLFAAQVTQARVRSADPPLVYHNREYHQLVKM